MLIGIVKNFCSWECYVQSKFIDISGKRFGKLVAIKVAYKKERMNFWLCKCDCGNETIVSLANLIGNNTKSCGCLKHVPYNITHNMTNTRLYGIWNKMKDRCYNKNNYKYRIYGDRDIKVCDEWLKDFINFYNWAMDNDYNDSLTIDRINVNGNYEPKNCRWTTMKVQQNNRTNNHWITYNNETHTISEWSDILNFPKYLIGNRLHRGWSE